MTTRTTCRATKAGTAAVAMAGNFPATALSGEADPVFAAIEKHRAANAAHRAAIDRLAPLEAEWYKERSGGEPIVEHRSRRYSIVFKSDPPKPAAYLKAEAAVDRACVASCRTFEALIATAPTTQAGLAALAEYVAASDFSRDWDEFHTFAATVAASLASLRAAA